MNSNGQRPSQDPRFKKSNDPNKPSTNNPGRSFSNQNSSYGSNTPNPIEPEITPTHLGVTPTPSISPIPTPSPSPSSYQSKSTTEQVTEKLKSSFNDLKHSKQVDDMYRYAVSNKEKTISYILLVLGLLILLFISDILGGLIIGLVAGYYFSIEIVNYIRQLPQFFEGHDQVRYAVLGVVIIGLLLEAPGILIGAAMMAAFKHIISNRNDRDEPSHPSRSNSENESGPRNR